MSSPKWSALDEAGLVWFRVDSEPLDSDDLRQYSLRVSWRLRSGDRWQRAGRDTVTIEYDRDPRATDEAEELRGMAVEAVKRAAKARAGRAVMA